MQNIKLIVPRNSLGENVVVEGTKVYAGDRQLEGITSVGVSADVDGMWKIRIELIANVEFEYIDNAYKHYGEDGNWVAKAGGEVAN